MMNTNNQSRRAFNQYSASAHGRADFNSQKSASSSSYSSRSNRSSASHNSSYSSRKPPTNKGKNIEKNTGKGKGPQGSLPLIGENEAKGFEYGSPWDIFNYQGGGAGYNDGAYGYPWDIFNHQGGGAGYNGGAYAAPANSTKTTRIVEGWGEGGCLVAAMAGVTGKDYGEVRPIAVKHGFVPHKGMKFKPARDALSELGKKAVYHSEQPSSWSEFPKKALVSVRGPGGQFHAVILKDEYIYDMNQSGPVHRSNYEIMKSSYIELK